MTAASSNNAPASSITAIQQQKQTLRKEVRRRRRSLTPRQQQQAALRLFHKLGTSALFRFSKRIAFTVARDGEIDPQLLLHAALKHGKACYLPVMNRFGESKLCFRRWQPGQKLAKGSYAIPEPRLGRLCPARSLSLVLMPLVGFDADCNRLGMGKGFYDHTFAFLRKSRRQRPVLLGLAHECQKVERLEVASWDVPLGGIVTDQHWYHG